MGEAALAGYTYTSTYPPPLCGPTPAACPSALPVQAVFHSNLPAGNLGHERAPTRLVLISAAMTRADAKATVAVVKAAGRRERTQELLLAMAAQRAARVPGSAAAAGAGAPAGPAGARRG